MGLADIFRRLMWRLAMSVHILQPQCIRDLNPASHKFWRFILHVRNPSFEPIHPESQRPKSLNLKQYALRLQLFLCKLRAEAWNCVR